MIFVLDRQENVVNVLKNDGDNALPFFDDILTEDLSTGSETFTFSTISKNNVANDLIIGNYVAFKKNGKYKLFQIMQTDERHEEVIYIDVYCECAGLSLINSVFRSANLVSATLQTFLNTVLSNTGWSTGYVDSNANASLDLNIADGSVYSVLQNNIASYGVELEFRVELNSGKISQKYVDAYCTRGSVTGKRFTYTRDIQGISRKTDSTSLYTALIGVGNNNISFRDITVDGINKPLGQDFVVDQDSFDKYNSNGRHIMGMYVYNTDSPQELLQATYNQLQKVKDPKLEYTVSVALLGDLTGEKWDTVAIGDTVAVYDSAFNPPIKVAARISQLQTSFTNPQNDACVLSNFVELSSNITNDMRNLSLQLQSYVDAKFPIAGTDIQEKTIDTNNIKDNAITNDKVDSLEAGKITSGTLDAGLITVKNLDGGSIKAGTIDASSIDATTITVDNANAALANIAKAIIGTAITIDTQSDASTIQVLNANYATIQTAQISNLTVKNNEGQTSPFLSEGLLADNVVNSNSIIDGAIIPKHLNIQSHILL